MMYTKVVSVESILTQHQFSNATKGNLTPTTKRAKNSPNSANSHKYVGTPPYIRSRCPPGREGKKIELVDLSQDSDELKTLAKDQRMSATIVGRTLPFTSTPYTLPMKIPKIEPMMKIQAQRRDFMNAHHLLTWAETHL